MSTLGMALVMVEARYAATQRLHLLHIVVCTRQGMTEAQAEQGFRDECARDREAVEQLRRLIAEHGDVAPASIWHASRARASGIPVEGGGEHD